MNGRAALIGAIGLTLVAALLFLYELATVLTMPSRAPAVSTSDTGATSVPLSSQPFSSLNQPSPMPALKFVQGEGRPISLTQFHGQPVLLNVWATWCLPCREEMPSLNRLQAKFDPANFRVVPLSIDRRGFRR